jgi:hypothetical protein
MDDAVVFHVKYGAQSRWPKDAHKRNGEIFYKKWGHKR